MRLIVHSKSTKRYVNEWIDDDTDLLEITSYPRSKSDFREYIEKGYDYIIGIGGGKVLDTAKLIGSINKPIIILIPTTGSGASKTSFATLWNKEMNKVMEESVKPSIRVTVIKEDYWKTLSKENIQESKADILAHLTEAYISKLSNGGMHKRIRAALSLLKNGDLINSSLIAGECINITKTNIIHAPSYYLTLNKDISHGKSVYIIMRRVIPYINVILPKDINEILSTIELDDIELTDKDIDMIAMSASSYKDKLYSTTYPMNYKILRRMLSGY